MSQELSKAEKKIARQLIDKGLDTAHKNALESLDKLISKWKGGEETNKEAYMNVYRELHQHDKGIGRRYNGLNGSRWFACISNLFSEDILTEEDIAPLREETKNLIYLGKEIDERHKY